MSSAVRRRHCDPVSRARVWEEVCRLNEQLGMTIFLTTQYLEEADELADRVGILNAGRLVAEGTPAAGIAGVEGVDARGSELVVTALDGSATIGPVAVALDGCGVRVRDLTLRTPTLDDVFLELTGTHIRGNENVDDETLEVTK